MKHFTRVLSLLTIAALTLFTSCKNGANEKTDDGKTTITFEKMVIEVSGDGGSYSIAYKIKNGINGIDITTETDTDWIKNIRTEEGRLHFDCDINLLNKERSGYISINYPNLNRKMIEVKQSLSNAIRFEMEVHDQKTTRCSTKITPSDSETPYIVYMAEQEYFLHAGITTADELFQDDYNIYMGWAKQYGVTNIEEFLYLNEIAFAGEADVTWTGMVPEKEYVLYAYAIEFNEDGTDYTLASPIYHTIITLSANNFEEIEFDVNVEVNGPKVTYTFNPIDWEGKYYIDIYSEHEIMYLAEGEVADEEYCKQIAKAWIDMITIYQQSGYSGEQLLELMCLQGADSYSELLEADTAYSMNFYGIEMVDGLPQVTTKPYTVNFRTGVVGASDMQIDIKVENCYVRVADITLTPTNDVDPYIATFLRKSDVPSYATTDELIIEWLANFNLSSYIGSVTTNVANLSPDTEYVLYAFGYYGGVVTTGLFSQEFKTEPEGVCQNSVIGVTHNGPYSLVELEAADPDKYYNYGTFESYGWYGMWAEIETEKPTKYVFHSIYRMDEIVKSGMDAVFADLVSYRSDHVQFLSGENGVNYVMCAVAMDERGNYSEMWMSEPFSYTLNKDTKRPIEELVNKLTPQTEPAKRSNLELRVNN